MVLSSLFNIGVQPQDDVNQVRLIRQVNGLNAFYTLVAFSVGLISFLFLRGFPGGLYMGCIQVLATLFYAGNLVLVRFRKIKLSQVLTLNVFEWHLFTCAVLTGLWDSPVMLVIVLYPLLAALVELSIFRHLAIGLFQFLLIFVLHTFFPERELRLNEFFGLAMGAREILRNMGLVYFPIMAAGIIKIIFNENLRARESLRVMFQKLDTAHSQLRRYADQLKDDTIRLKAELNVARDIQMMILPNPDELESLGDFSFASVMNPADEVGGDYYDVIHNTGQPLIGIGDVTGHGLSSGLIMLMAQTAIRTVAEMGVSAPEAFLPVINRVLYSNIQRIGEDRNMTLSLVRYRGNGTYRLAGQHESYLICRTSGVVENHETMDLGFFIGLMPEVEDHIQAEEFHLDPADVLVLYTDGVTEAENEQGEQFGLDRLKEVLMTSRHLSCEMIKEKIVRKLFNFIENTPVMDDISFLVIKQRSSDNE